MKNHLTAKTAGKGAQIDHFIGSLNDFAVRQETTTSKCSPLIPLFFSDSIRLTSPNRTSEPFRKPHHFVAVAHPDIRIRNITEERAFMLFISGYENFRTPEFML